MANKTYTTMSLDALKFLCSVINGVVDLPTSVISDTSVATNTTYSSYKIGLDMDNMENEIKSYVDTIIAGLNKLTKEIINDKALVVKDNVLYLYKAADDVSNNYMQMMLINGVAVELGSTQADFSNIYDKSEVDSKFAAKLDLDTLTNSFNTHIGDTTIHITQDEKDSYVKKTDIATALDDTATDEQVTSALLTKTELDKLSASLGELSELKTTEKTNLVGAINETRQSNGAACTLGQGVNLTKNQIFVCPNDGYIVGTLKWNASGYFTIMVVDGSKATQIMQYGHKSDPGANINLPMYVRKGMSIRFVGTAGAVSFYPFE